PCVGDHAAPLWCRPAPCRHCRAPCGRMASGEWRIGRRPSLLATRYSLFAIRALRGYGLARRLPAAPSHDQPVDRRARRWPREQEALHLVAAGETKQDALLLGLDALAHHHEPERAAERDDRLDDDAAVGRAAERSDEFLVDLELVDRKT